MLTSWYEAGFNTNAMLVNKMKQPVESQKAHFVFQMHIIARRSAFPARLRNQSDCYGARPVFSEP